jgi:hypothetical protein
MCNRPLVTTIAIVGLVAAGCEENTKEQSPGEVLARDSSLASEIRLVDTSAVAEAGDVASPVPTRVDRPRIRPKPATIHPEPIPTRTLPPAPAPHATATNHVDRSAAEILAKVPGAELTPSAKSRAIARRNRRGP